MSGLTSYLSSARNYVGLASGAAATGLTLWSGAAGPLWPLVTAAAYGIGALVTPAPRRTLGELKLSADVSADELVQALEDVRKHTPADVAGQVDGICSSLRDVLARWAMVQQNPNIAHDVTATILDYLPTTVEAYAKVPAHLRPDAMAGHASARDTVTAQLRTLQEYADSTRDAAYADDLRQLEQQGQFLASKWQRSSLDLPGS